MSAFMRYAGLAAVAGLIGLVGCGSTSARSPGQAQSPAPATTAPSAASPAPSTATPGPTVAPAGKPSVQPGSPAQVCSQAGTYLTAVRTGEHSAFDCHPQTDGRADRQAERPAG